ncbi:DinB family protein [Bacillus sp. JCM 19034]|uniref:DinB family protein n=1 Tax=Bacillus sp. JCM 19034 TaxID=1481928 RepID=UPI001E51DD39|nr:DinB family protein [Bacillus sp. JCM 19034]
MKQLKSFLGTVNEVEKLKDQSSNLLNQPIANGKWSTKEIIAHMYYWDYFILHQMVPNMVDGAKLTAFPDHNKHNEEGLELVGDQSIESIIKLFIETREKLVRELDALEEDIRFTIGAGKRQFSIESFVKIFVRHDAHHLKQIHELVE